MTLVYLSVLITLIYDVTIIGTRFTLNEFTGMMINFIANVINAFA